MAKNAERRSKMNKIEFELITHKHAFNPTFEEQKGMVKEILASYELNESLVGFTLSSFKYAPIKLVPCMDLHLKSPIVLVYDGIRKGFYFYTVVMEESLYTRRYTNDPLKEVNILEEIVKLIPSLDLVAWTFEGARFSFDKLNDFNSLCFGSLTLFRYHANVNHFHVTSITKILDMEFGIELGDIIVDKLKEMDPTLDCMNPEVDFTGIYELANACLPRLAYLKRRKTKVVTIND